MMYYLKSLFGLIVVFLCGVRLHQRGNYILYTKQPWTPAWVIKVVDKVVSEVNAEAMQGYKS